jgi:hypothetical protein
VAGMAMRFTVVALAISCSVGVSSAAFAQVRIVVTPVQGESAGAMAIEIEEALRQGALVGAKDRGALVMTRKTMEARFVSSAQQLTAAGVVLPCKSPECDAKTTATLEADYALSSKLVKVDDNYLLLVKLLRAKDGGQLVGSTTIENKTIGGVLGAAPATAEKLLLDFLTAPKPVLDTAAVRKRGHIYVGKAGTWGASYSDCSLYIDRLECTTDELFGRGRTTTINFSEVASVAAGDDAVLLQMTWNLQYELTMYATKTERQDGIVAVELERQRHRETVVDWQTAVQQAYAAYQASK